MTMDIEGSELTIHYLEDSLSSHGVLGPLNCGHASVDPAVSWGATHYWYQRLVPILCMV